MRNRGEGGFGEIVVIVLVVIIILWVMSLFSCGFGGGKGSGKNGDTAESAESAIVDDLAAQTTELIVEIRGTDYFIGRRKYNMPQDVVDAAKAASDKSVTLTGRTAQSGAVNELIIALREVNIAYNENFSID